jgi:uncharacterized membrane protein
MVMTASNSAATKSEGWPILAPLRNGVRSWQKEHLIDLEDACVVERGKYGKVRIKQAVSMTALAAARGGSMGALWGTLVGLLFLNPLLEW